MQLEGAVLIQQQMFGPGPPEFHGEGLLPSGRCRFDGPLLNRRLFLGPSRWLSVGDVGNHDTPLLPINTVQLQRSRRGTGKIPGDALAGDGNGNGLLPD